MDDLLSDFIAETRETLAAIADEIVAWAADPGDRTRLDAIFRFVHTLKASAAVIGLPRLERLGHAAEDALAGVRAGTRAADGGLARAVLAILDRIRDLLDMIASGGALPDSADHALIAALAGGAGPIAAAPSPPHAPGRSVRVPADLFDRLQAGIAEAARARDELAAGLAAGGAGAAALGRLSAALAALDETVAGTRVARLDQLFAPLPRIVRALAAQLGREVALTVEGGHLTLDRATIELLRDPLLHLVRNALDHGIEPPDARGAAGKPRAGRLAVSAQAAAGGTLIEIADDGRGIDVARLGARAMAAGIVTPAALAAMPPPERLALVFAPGLSTALKVTAVSGRGVGMDVVRAELERAGGRIALDSRPGRGLRVALHLPRAPVAGTARTARTCLVVDDSRVIRKAARALLEARQFAVAEAADGREALARCAADAPDMILLDLNMPVMGGLEFLRALPRRGPARRPKLVVCTTETRAALVAEAVAAGADAHLAKPFDHAALGAALARIGLG